MATKSPGWTSLRSVLGSSAGTALVREPAFWVSQNRDPAFAALLEGDAFLRSNVDKAIESLTNDVTLLAIFEVQKFPARIVK